MTGDEVRSLVLALPDAVEGAHHGHPDFRVGKSIFATFSQIEDRAVLRLPLEFAETFEGDAFRIVSRSGGAGWLSVELSKTDRDTFEPLVELAHNLIREKKQRK